MRNVLAAVVIALLWSGCTEGKAPPKVDPEQPPPAEVPVAKAPELRPDTPAVFVPFRPGVYLSDSQHNLDNGAFSSRFNFAHLRELWIRVKVSGMPHMGTLSFVLTDPHGNAVFEGSSAFSPDPNMRQTDVPGALNPVSVFYAKPVTGGFLLDYAIPVSGSVIQRYMRSGTWSIATRVDGAMDALSSTFEVSTVY
jgi:hypothetical protein